MELEPIDPETAVELYLAEKETELAKATIDSHRSRLGHLVRWCGERDLDYLNDLSGRRLHEYRIWRRDDGELTKVSLKTRMDTVRVFVRWLATIDGVHPDLHLKIPSPTITPEENTRDVARQGVVSRVTRRSIPDEGTVHLTSENQRDGT